MLIDDFAQQDTLSLNEFENACRLSRYTLRKAGTRLDRALPNLNLGLVEDLELTEAEDYDFENMAQAQMG